MRHESDAPVHASLHPRLSSTIGTARRSAYCAKFESVCVANAARNTRFELRLNDYPAIRAFVESIRGTLAGDLAALRRYYRVELEGTWSDWRLHLLPADQQMAELVLRTLPVLARVLRGNAPPSLFQPTPRDQVLSELDA